MPSFLLRSAVAMAASAAYIAYRSRKTEEEHPPTGQFVEVDGVRLHYTEQGQGRPLVLLHGLATMGVDFQLSGLVALTARDYRVIIFDRPGYGHSERPHARSWDVLDQARLFQQAFKQLGLERPLVLGHSYGALLALALALEFPDAVSGLILESGYFYPAGLPDLHLLQDSRIPVVGEVLRYSIAPWLIRAAWPTLIKRVFAPGEVPAAFEAYPTWMALRPSQLEAASAELGQLIQCATALSARYAELSLPVTILAGREDALLPSETHSVRLHGALASSELRLLDGAGHMLHYQAPETLREAIDSVATRSTSSTHVPPAAPPIDPLAGTGPDA